MSNVVGLKTKQATRTVDTLDIRMKTAMIHGFLIAIGAPKQIWSAFQGLVDYYTFLETLLAQSIDKEK